MGFLNPSALWLMPLAAAPLVLHLLSVRRARRVAFSDLTLLREARRRALPAARLRQWLLVAARCLVLAALVAALARPVVRGAAAPGAADSGMDLVVLLDTSWSMRASEAGRPRFEAARDAARAAAAFAGDAGRVAAGGVSAGLDAPLAFSESAAAAQAALGRLAPGWRGTDLAAGVSAACRFLAAQPAAAERRRVVALFSDGAATAAQGFGRGAAPADCPPDVALVGLAPAAGLSNAAVLSAAPAHDGHAPGLEARLALFGGARRASSLDLVLRGARAGRRAVELTPGSPASFALSLPPQSDAEAWGRAELPPDALAEDDAWNFALRAEPRPKVLLLTGSPRSLEAGGGGYALRALLSEGGRLPYRLDAADLGRLSQVRLAEFSALVLDDPRALTPAGAAALARYVEEGGGLWVVAGPRGGSALGALEPVLPCVLGGERLGPAEPGLRPDAAPAAGPEAYAWTDFELSRVAVDRRWDCSPRPGATVWFRDASGAPLLLAGERGRGRVLLWASSLEVGWTNLALKPVFAAWTDAGLRWLARYHGLPVWRGLRVGEPLVRVWDGAERAPASVTLTGPGGRRTTLLVRGRRVEYPDTKEPGHYRLEWEGAAEGRAQAETWAVNVDRLGGEGDLTPAAAVPWRALRPASLREDFDAAVSGSEARGGLLAALLLLLVLEAFLARPAAAAAALFLALAVPASAQTGDLFVWSQLRYSGGWDPYPAVPADLTRWVAEVTSIRPAPARREVTLKDPALFSSPFLVLAGKAPPPVFDDEESGRLRDYLTSGGFLWLDDSSGLPGGAFDRWVKGTLAKALPDAELKALPADHVLFKTFFLVRRPNGRARSSAPVWGVEWGGRLVAVYTQGDVLGAWARDPLGANLHDCVPGGEAQRQDARKLSLNIVMYALTGNYKADAVHQPFLLEKMRSGAP